MTQKINAADVWNLFRAGKLDQAETLSIKLINAGETKTRVPLAQVWATKAIYDAMKGERAAALRRLYRALDTYPDNTFLRHAFLGGLSEREGQGRAASGRRVSIRMKPLRRSSA